MALSAKIKTIQNIMRQDSGVDGDAQRISQLGWLIFLKIFDDRERELEVMKGNYKSPMPEELRWRSWASDDEGITGDALLNFINNDLFPKLKNLEIKSSDDKKVIILRSVFEDAFNYMKSGTLLRQVVNELNDIDFASSDDRHVFNDVYEKILNDLQSAGNAGEFYTPRTITQFIVDMVDPKLGEKVFDPACGTGGFLTSVIEHVRKNEVKTGEDNEILANSIYGVEKKPLPHLLCTTNMILHGIDDPSNIIRGNSLVRPLRDYTESDRVHVIVTNPPFGGTEEDGIELGFPKNFQTRETADLFLVSIIHLLKENGRVGIVLPDGSLSGEGVKQRIREHLLTKCNLHTIIRLPNSVFKPYATVSTNLLFFSKGEPTKEVWYYEHQLPEGYKSYSKTKPIQLSEFDVIKKWWINRKEGPFSWKVDIKDIESRGFNLDIKNPNVQRKKIDQSPEEIIAEIRNNQRQIDQLLNEVEKLIQS